MGSSEMSDADSECRRWLVSGKVQGVFFRASTEEFARGLGLDGSARNLADGRVEVVALGSPAKLDRLAEWLESGPSAAHVARVETTACAEIPAKGFVTK